MTIATATTVCFNVKSPDTTAWIEIEHAVTDVPEELLADLAAVGFAPDGLATAPPLNGVETARLCKRGSGLFAGWTEAERTENMKAARAVLARHGFKRVPLNKLTWQDLI